MRVVVVGKVGRVGLAEEILLGVGWEAWVVKEEVGEEILLGVGSVA